MANIFDDMYVIAYSEDRQGVSLSLETETTLSENE